MAKIGIYCENETLCCCAKPPNNLDLRFYNLRMLIFCKPFLAIRTLGLEIFPKNFLKKHLRTVTFLILERLLGCVKQKDNTSICVKLK